MKSSADLAKEAGMQLALEFEPAAWKEKFLAFAEDRAKFLPIFRMEDLRADFLGRGNPPPHTHKVWGAIAREIPKRGIGVFDGYVKSVSKKTHAHPVASYRSLRFNQKEAA